MAENNFFLHKDSMGRWIVQWLHDDNGVESDNQIVLAKDGKFLGIEQKDLKSGEYTRNGEYVPFDRNKALS